VRLKGDQLRANSGPDAHSPPGRGVNHQADPLDAAISTARPDNQRARMVYHVVCMKRTNIYLAEGQAAALDRAAEAAGVSRAELIRELTDRAIGGHPGMRFYHRYLRPPWHAAPSAAAPATRRPRSGS